MSSRVDVVKMMVPKTVDQPLEIEVTGSALNMVLVPREAVRHLEEKWHTDGVYFLLGPHKDPEKFRVYVGKVPTGTLVKRMSGHRKKLWWNKALFIQHSSNKFDSAQVGWLEGRLHEILLPNPYAVVENKRRPSDDSLSKAEEENLERRFVKDILTGLRAVGAPVNAPSAAADSDASEEQIETVAEEEAVDLIAGAKKQRKRRTTKRGSVGDLLDQGLIAPGEVLLPNSAQVERQRPLRRTGQSSAAASRLRPCRRRPLPPALGRRPTVGTTGPLSGRGRRSS